MSASGEVGCCCHDLDDECAYGWPQRHVHRCLPRALDLGGHCPDAGCGGQCWTNEANQIEGPS